MQYWRRLRWRASLAACAFVPRHISSLTSNTASWTPQKWNRRSRRMRHR
jgi:hypothetical protein